MTPETYISPIGAPSDPREVVERFYAAVSAKNVDAIVQLADDRFAPDVVVREPESLPYGGSYEGLEKVKRLFTGLASPRSPIDAEQMVIAEIMEAVSVADHLNHVVVAIRFPWTVPGAEEPLQTKALEWWTFTDLKVTEIQAFYWDTGACVALLGAAGQQQHD
jgi:hypothetical protein